MLAKLSALRWTEEILSVKKSDCVGIEAWGVCVCVCEYQVPNSAVENSRHSGTAGVLVVQSLEGLLQLCD